MNGQVSKLKSMNIDVNRDLVFDYGHFARQPLTEA